MNHHQVASLPSGDLDPGIITLRMVDRQDLQVRIVQRSQLALAVPSIWLLAKRDALRMADLAEPVRELPAQLSPASDSAVMAACRDAGFRSNVIQETAHPSRQ